MRTSILKRLVALLIFCSLGVASTPFHYANAGAAGGGATEATQLLNFGRLQISTAMETISASANQLTAFLTGQLQIKEFILDPIAWFLAKGIISRITNDLIAWVNSGFQGRPAFVTELDRYILEQLDVGVGQFLSQLDPAISNFVCDPYAFDIQFALASNYQESTLQKPRYECTATDIVNNLEGFVGGNYADGGLAGMFEMSAKSQNTPMGSYLEAQVSFNDAMAEIRSKELSLLNFGDGFLSQEICEGGDKTNCYVTTPGKVISEALNFQLSTGQRNLIAADEIDEFIGELLAALVNTALSGVGGLLGLTSNSYSRPPVRTGGTNFLGGGGTPGETLTNPNAGAGSALDEAIADNEAQSGGASEQSNNLRTQISERETVQQSAANVATSVIVRYNSTPPGDRTEEMDRAFEDANDMLLAANQGLGAMADLESDLNAAEALPEEEQAAAISSVYTNYASTLPDLVSEGQIIGLETFADSLF